MLERLAHWMALSVVACSACSAQSSADQERSSAAGAVFDENSSDASMVHGPMLKTAAVGEALCPGSREEMPRVAGSPLWLQSYDTGQITSVASDSAGNVLVAHTGAGFKKLSCAGTPLWSKPFGAQVALDAHDDVYVAGTFAGTLAVDESTLQTDGSAAFVVKLDAAGNVVYARVLGETAEGTQGTQVAIDGIAVDGQGQVALSGQGFGTVMLDDSGGVLWRKPFSGKVRFDSAGNLLLAGELVGTLDVGPGTLTSQGGSDILLLKLDAAGTPILARSYGDAGMLQRATALAVDDADNAVIAGTFDGRLDFGVGALELTPAQCSSEAWCVTNGFAAKLDAAGQALWSVTFGPMRAVSGVAVDLNGNSVLSGALPGGVRPFQQTWLAKLDPNGTEIWRRSEWPDTGIGAGHGVAIDPRAQVFWSLSARPSLDLEEQSYLVKLEP